MRQPTHQRFTLAEPADVGVARRAVCGIAGSLGATDDARGRAELVATELGTNLVRHGGGGTILARPLPDGSIEIIHFDWRRLHIE